MYQKRRFQPTPWQVLLLATAAAEVRVCKPTVAKEGRRGEMSTETMVYLA